MKDEELKKQVQLGAEAEKFVQNPAYQQALMEIRAEQFRLFKATGTNQRDERDEVWRLMKSLDLVEGKLNRFIRDGTLANETLAERIKKKFKN